MKKLMLVLALGLAVAIVNAQDNTTKGGTAAKPATQNNVKSDTGQNSRSVETYYRGHNSKL